MLPVPWNAFGRVLLLERAMVTMSILTCPVLVIRNIT